MLRIPSIQSVRPFSEAGGILLVAVSDTGYIQFSNAAAVDFFGLPQDSTNDRHISSLFSSADHSEQLLADIQAQGSISLPQIIIRCRNGSARIADVHAIQCVTADTNRSPIIVLFSEPDLVESADDTLDNPVARFQHVAHSARIGLMDWNFSAGTIIVDHVVRELFGIEEPGYAFNYDTMISFISEYIHTDMVADMDAFFKSDASEYTADYPVVSSEQEDTWLHLHSVAFREKNGAVSRMLSVVTDMTSSKRSSRQVSNRLRYEHGIAAVSSLLVSTERGEAVIDDCLQILLETTDVSRVYIFENFTDQQDGLCMRQTHEVCAEGVSVEIDNPILLHLPYREGYMRWHDSLSVGNPIFGLVPDFPEDERVVLEPQDIKSLLVIPINVHREWFGFIGFDHTVHTRQWTADDILLLRTAAELIGIYIGRVRDQEFLRTSEESFRGVFTFSSIGMALIGLDGSLIDANASFTEMLGRPVNSIRSRQLIDVLHLNDESMLTDAFDCILQDSAKRVRIELQVKHEQGHLLWLDTRLSLILQSEDAPKFFLAQFQDISKRRKAEEALRESEERYKVLFQSGYTVNIIIDPGTGHIIDVNAAAGAFFGISRAELLSSSLGGEQLFDDDRILLLISEALGQSGMFEYVYQSQKKSPLNLQIYPTPVTIRQHEYVFLIIRDVTERKRLEEHLLIRQKMDSLGDLAGGMAHDFNNLLTGIMGNLDLLQFDFAELSEQHREYINDAYSCCLKSSDLLKKIQLLSKSTFFQRVVLDVSVIASEVVGLLDRTTDPLVEKRNDIKPGVYTVCINPDHLRQVLMNLGTNAIRAIENRGVRDGDWTRISARKYTASPNNPREFAPGEYVHIMFKDNGEGMTEETKLRAFDPLFSTKRRGTQKGQGLGLAVVYNIITRHNNGYVDIATSSGKGTTVHIYLPFVPAADENNHGSNHSESILNQQC